MISWSALSQAAPNQIDAAAGKNALIIRIDQPVIKNQQITHMWQLEQLAPEYDHAVKGMASSFTAFGLMLSVVTLNPSWYIFFSIFLIAKMLPSASSIDSTCEQKPSILGEIVYRHDDLRDLGNRLYDTIALLTSSNNGLFSKKSDDATRHIDKHIEQDGTILHPSSQ